MKKIIRILLIVMSIALFTSCSAQQAPEIVPDYDTFGVDPEEINMQGYKCIVLQENFDGHPEQPFYYEEDSLFCDMMRQRERDLEQKYNCEISFENRSINDVQKSAVSNLNLCNLVYCSGSNINFSYAKAGYFYPLTELSSVIDLSDSEKYGNAYVLETCMFQGVPYGVAPLYLPYAMSDSCLYVVYLNEEIIQNNGFTDPRDLYEQKKWTYGAFNQVTDEFYISEGDKKIYSLTVPGEGTILNGFENGAGIRLYYENDSGELKPGYMAPQAIEAIDQARLYINNHKNQICTNYSGDIQNSIINGDTVMLYKDAFYLSEISRRIDNFGIVPFPVNGTTTQNGEETQGFSTLNTMSVFVGSKEPEFDALVLSELLEPLEGCETRDAMAEFLYKTVFYDMRDTYIYMDLHKHAYFSYYAVMQGFTGTSVGDLFNKGKSGIEIVSSIEDELDKEINYYFAPSWFGYIKDAVTSAE